jgi:ribosome maturation factor RimP
MEKPMSIKTINERINKEICHVTIDKLKDNSLLDTYKECKSVKNQIKKLEAILDKNNITLDVKNNIISSYLLELIPPGTKGVIRGNKFNKIIKDEIIKIFIDNKIDEDKYELKFETICEKYNTTEIPDWYILEKESNKVLIGMNQLDLWGGGQQVNRGSKYLKDNKHNTKNSKLLCVVCNHIEIKGKNKVYELFNMGFSNNTICYVKNLENIILNYFGINKNIIL